jgi:hypothetical protein
VPSIFIVSLKKEAAVFSETLSAKLHGVTSQNITNVLEFLRTLRRFSQHIKVPAVTRLAVLAAGESVFQTLNDILNNSWNHKAVAILCAVTCPLAACSVIRVNKSFCPPHGVVRTSLMATHTLVRGGRGHVQGS